MEQKKAFFSVLAGDLGVDHESVLRGVEKLRDLYSQVIIKNCTAVALS